MNLYPNPVTDNLSIEIPTEAGQSVTFRIYNAMGSILKEGNVAISDNILDVSANTLGNGLLYYRNIR